MYNKQQFHKFNCKKVLHKVKKQWVTISVALLMMLGGGAVATHVSANASQAHQSTKTSVTTQAHQLHQNLLHKQFNHHATLATSPSTNTSQSGNLNGVNYKINEYTDGYDVSPSSIEFTNGNMQSNHNASVTGVLDKADLGVGPSDYHLNSVKFDDNVNTSNDSNLSDLLTTANGDGENQVYFGKNFDTRKAYHSTHQTVGSDISSTKHTVSGTYHLLQENNNSSDGISSVKKVTITSPKTIFNTDAINGKNADNWKNARTGQVVSLGDGKSHVGTWIQIPFNQRYHLYRQYSRNTGKFDGLHFKYNPKKQFLEFTNGTMLFSNFTRRNQPVNFLAYMPKLFSKAKTIKFDNKVNVSKAKSMKALFAIDSHVQHIILSHSFNPKSVNNMESMFEGDKNLKSIKFPNDFNTNKVTNMSDMLASDSKLKSINLPKSFKTYRVSNMSWIFSNDNSLHFINLPIYFNTLKAMRTRDSYGQNGVSHMFSYTPLTNLHLHSTKTRFNRYSGLKRHWRKTNSRRYTNLMNKQAHVGNWTTKSYRYRTRRHYRHHTYRSRKSHRRYR